MPSFGRLHWRGEAVKQRVVEASIAGVNEVMATCVLQAKQNHPGWIYRTGTAERSVQVQEAAHRVGSGAAGRWGSVGTDYVRILELKHGAFLRTAADTKYPELAGAIRRHFNG